VKRKSTLLACLPLLALPLCAQVQIGGGTCSSASLSGNYSLTLTGRDVSSKATFSSIVQGVGTAAFDGLSKVTFSLTNNTNLALGTAVSWSGTYTMQANCVGTLTISAGDAASFSLESFNGGKNYLISGQDAAFSFTGNGGMLPATCSASQLSGVYSFNATGWGISTATIAGADNISGLLTFDGKGTVSATWYVASGATNSTANLSGLFTVNTGCTGSATITDASANVYTILFTITTTNGSNFLLAGSNATLIFTGSARTL
jgi:hypothetical protein